MTRALVWKAWRESRARFLVGALVVGGLCAAFVGFADAFRAHMPAGTPYASYLYARVYGGVVRSIFVLLAVVLGTGGLAREHALGTLGFTLALPVPRARHALVRAAVGLAEIVALAALPVLIVPAGSALVGESFPLGAALTLALLWAAVGAVLLAASFVVAELVRHDYLALMVALVVVRGVPVVLARAGVPASLDGVMSGRAQWTGASGTPWLALAGLVAGAAGLVALGTRATAREGIS